MDVSAATEPVPGRPNDDGYLAGPGFAAVLDGCTDPGCRDSGCAHDVPWLVARLSGNLAAALSTGFDRPLPELLAEAIRRTCGEHGDACDLSNPDSPSSTVTILRESGDTVDYLVLADSPLLLEYTDGALDVIVDDQVNHLPSYTYDSVARLRNAAGGFWVASTAPEAAWQGVSGSVPRNRLRRALLLTDGASRLAERYGRPWRELLDLADRAGVRELLRQVHREDAAAQRIRESTGESVRGKVYDDATAVLCRIADSAFD
jgi:hypothetical protein